MDYVGRYAMLSKLCGYIAHFVLCLVGDAAHPEAERPQRRHRTPSRQRSVLRENFLRTPQKNEQVEILVFGVDDVVLVVILSKVEGHRRAGVHEHAVAAAAHEKWY